jgi:hypothetical protein
MGNYRSMGWKGENILHVHSQGGLGKCKVKAPHVTTLALGS